MEKLKFVDLDGWERPVYKDAQGQLWKDCDPRFGAEPILCAACNNEFEGEPDYPFTGVADFDPGRVCWKRKGGRMVIGLQ